MRLAILSDIHANLVALQAVLEEVDKLQPDALWCLGDILGYGPEPQACADLIRERAEVCLAGNHDLAVAGEISLDDFNEIAWRAAEWQIFQLREETLEWVRQLPAMRVYEDITLAHGSPRAPVWEYITSDSLASDNADFFTTQLCLVGHSHLAVGWELKELLLWTRATAFMAEPDQPVLLEEDARWLLNPGSVGQPRDGDPRASFALLNTDAHTWTWHRVEYDIDAVAQALTEAGLPTILGRRLYEGW